MTVRLLDRVVIPARLALICRGDETIGYNPRLNIWHRLDGPQAETLRWLRAGRRREELKAHLNRRFAFEGLAGERLEAILGWCLLRRLLFLDREPAAPEISFPSRPFSTVYWITTQACNLRCTYCYQNAALARANELTTAEARDLIEQAVEAGAGTFIFTGGEPFVRRDLLSLAAYSKSLGLRTNVITNGAAINRRNIGRVSKIFDLVSVSLDHSDPAHHDRHRGNGSWARTTAAIELLIEAGVRLDINSVLSRLGLRDIGDFLRWRRERRIGQHRIVPQFPMGRGSGASNDALTADELLGLSDRLLAENRALDADAPPAGDRPHSAADSSKGLRRDHCGAGLSEVSVDPEGFVYPCKLLQYARYRGENVRDMRLRDIYARGTALIEARARRATSLQPCRSCIIRAHCGGGCRGIHASFTGGDAARTDPLFCGYLRRSFEVQAWADTGAVPPARRAAFQTSAA